MDIPRLEAKGVALDLVSDAIKHACLDLGYAAATSDQAKAIKEFLQGRDVFVSLPTGEGKSLCFAALPGVFDFLKRQLALSSDHHLAEPSETSSICIVVSPLIALMKDQVAKFSDRGLQCAYVGEEQDDLAVKAGVVAGDFQLVYMSPESLLCVLQWREMFRSEIYQKNLVAAIVDEAHCVEKWLVSCICILHLT